MSINQVPPPPKGAPFRKRTGRILVVGDCFADRVWYGVAERLVRDTAAPVIRLIEEQPLLPGGAAHIATLLADLNCDVVLATIFGDEPRGRELMEALNNSKVSTGPSVVAPAFTTNSRTRILASNDDHIYQKVCRVVDGPSGVIGHTRGHQSLLENIQAIIADFEAVVVADFGSGVISESLMERIVSDCGKLEKPVFFDPHIDRNLCSPGVTLVKPNLRELQTHCDKDETWLNIDAGQDREFRELIWSQRSTILNAYDAKMILTTFGEWGMSLLFGDSIETQRPCKNGTVADDVSAGDAVMAGFILAYLNKFSPDDCLLVARCAADTFVQTRKSFGGDLSITRLVARMKAEGIDPGNFTPPAQITSELINDYYSK